MSIDRLKPKTELTKSESTYSIVDGSVKERPNEAILENAPR